MNDPCGIDKSISLIQERKDKLKSDLDRAEYYDSIERRNHPVAFAIASTLSFLWYHTTYDCWSTKIFCFKMRMINARLRRKIRLYEKRKS